VCSRSVTCSNAYCPAVVEAAAQPFKSTTWAAALSVVVARDDGNLARTRRLGLDRFTRLVRTEVIRVGRPSRAYGSSARSSRRSARPRGWSSTARPAFERIGWILTDWERARADQIVVEARMVAVLGQLELTDLVCSIDGLSPVGAAAILVETGDLPGSPPPAPWSSSPGWPLGKGCPAPSPARPACPAPDGRGCGRRRGGRCGDAYRTTACTPPAIGT
jgi:hypothetical protein